MRPNKTIGGVNKNGVGWRLIPKNKWFNVSVHKFTKSDDAKILHNHQYRTMSIILKGILHEYWLKYEPWKMKQRCPFIYERNPGDVIFRSKDIFHSLVLKTPVVWTLFITGRDRGQWHFLVDNRLIESNDYIQRQEKMASAKD